MPTRSYSLIRRPLGTLLLLVALNAFGGGWYGMAGADAVPISWLEGSPFRDYFIPSMILFVVVGGSALLSAISVFMRQRKARFLSFLCTYHHPVALCANNYYRSCVVDATYHNGSNFHNPSVSP
ncbi:hypothetical protein [Chryseobacterium sp.]|uniref:hypothetical protein n=1 Tax=Chryseobacterium sp. TaxID=1871047 RepID=UPI0012A7C697|nr:hypothetical protein [Chryseobacterium sp.]QFG53380.1 hypothetical protein F7R58_07400 [Chryseobacterium sp.]